MSKHSQTTPETPASAPPVTVKIDIDKLAHTKMGVIRRLSSRADIDSIYEFMAPLVEGGEAALDELEIGQLKALTEQVKTAMERLGNPGN